LGERLCACETIGRAGKKRVRGEKIIKRGGGERRECRGRYEPAATRGGALPSAGDRFRVARLEERTRSEKEAETGRQKKKFCLLRKKYCKRTAESSNPTLRKRVVKAVEAGDHPRGKASRIGTQRGPPVRGEGRSFLFP